MKRKLFLVPIVTISMLSLIGCGTDPVKTTENVTTTPAETTETATTEEATTATPVETTEAQTPEAATETTTVSKEQDTAEGDTAATTEPASNGGVQGNGNNLDTPTININPSTRTLEEKHNNYLKDLADWLADGTLTQEQYDKLVARSNREYEEAKAAEASTPTSTPTSYVTEGGITLIWDPETNSYINPDAPYNPLVEEDGRVNPEENWSEEENEYIKSLRPFG